MFKHILVATDFTHESDGAARKALSLAEKSGAKISLVHFLEYLPVLFDRSDLKTPTFDNTMEESVQVRTRNQLAEQGKKLGIPAKDQYLEVGEDMETNLPKIIDRLHVDLLVIGSHQHHGLGQIFNSTANSILHQMPCDVLTIHF